MLHTTFALSLFFVEGVGGRGLVYSSCNHFQQRDRKTQRETDRKRVGRGRDRGRDSKRETETDREINRKTDRQTKKHRDRRERSVFLPMYFYIHVFSFPFSLSLQTVWQTIFLIFFFFLRRSETYTSRARRNNLFFPSPRSFFLRTWETCCGARKKNLFFQHNIEKELHRRFCLSLFPSSSCFFLFFLSIWKQVPFPVVRNTPQVNQEDVQATGLTCEGCSGIPTGVPCFKLKTN